MKIWHIQLDSNGYITDITGIGPLLDGYTAVETDAEVPAEIMRGYYKWNAGFELDVDKKVIVDAELAALPMFPPQG